MNSKYKSILAAVSSLMLTGAMLLPTGASAQEGGAENVQVLTRGPVHEAFAEAVSYDPQPGLIVSSRVPDPIEEIPPEQKPEGDNVTWISGYWAWDEDQNDFIWISGIWRNLPPGRQWVPGYWNEVSDGQYQWTSGYWADATTEEVTYVPTAPPKTVEAGPNVEAPSSDHSWVPGNWYWADTRYAWRPGYWIPQRTNWIWIPSRYCWTRRGYVYVDGYWDYGVARRGVLFAPVYFRERVYTSPDYYYTPLIVVALNVFSNHLFVRPRYGHYYFGDYYAPRYQTGGFYSSFSWYSDRRGYDPIYAYDRWEHREDRSWERRRQEDFNYFRDNEDARPPRTWAAMRDYRDDRYSDGRNRVYATSLSSIAQDPQRAERFRTLDQESRQQFASKSKEVRKFSQERRQVESRQIAATEDSRKVTAVREKTSRSPITGREAEQFAEKEAPPKRPEARGTKSDVRPAIREAPQTDTGRKGDMRQSDTRQQTDTDRKGERGSAQQQDRTEAQPGPERRQSESKQERPSKQVEPQVTPRKDQQAPQREERTKQQVQPAPERKVQSAPKPERQPQQAAPEPTQRKQQQSQPQERGKQQVQPAPERKAQPERQPQQAAPAPTQRKQQQAQPQERPKQQAQPAPERKVQSAPKPERQPQQAAPQPVQRKQQQAPQPQERPKQQAQQPAPERKQQAAPAPQQRQPQQAAPQTRKPAEQRASKTEEEEKGKGKNR